MTEDIRARARQLALRHMENGDALGWFEALYAEAGGDTAIIPWADSRPNPNLVAWLDEAGREVAGRRALAIGCGLGDDAEELARRGCATTAFDISGTAVAWCRRRFPDSTVRYQVADLLAPPQEWTGAFEFVLESYTLQALPPSLREQAIANVAAFVAPGGTLLVIARAREPEEPEGSMPWPLTRDDLALFEAGLTASTIEDYIDKDRDGAPVRRFRVAYRREQREPPGAPRRT